MKLNFKFRTNTYLATLYQLCVALFVLWLTRYFFYLFNSDIFTDISARGLWQLMGNGLRFDLAALLYLNMVFVTMRLLPFGFTRKKGYRRAENWVYYIFNSIGIIANITDTPYYRFTNIRTNTSLLTEFMQDANAAGIIGKHMLTYWYLILVAAAFILLLVWLYRRVEISAHTFLRNNALGYTIRTVILIASYGVMVLCIRGGIFIGKPMGLNDATRYVEQNRDIAIVLNTPYSVIRSLGKESTVRELTYFCENEVEAIYTPYYPAKDSVGEFRPKNVVIILLEGIGMPFVQAVNKVKGAPKDSIPLMPFLESLCQKSLIFTEAYSTGRKSSAGTTAVFAGFPIYKAIIHMASSHNTNDIDGVPALLSDKGYGSIFYCGCYSGSYGFESIARGSGYKQFVGIEEYGNDKHSDGTWGIFDDKMGKFIASDLNTMPQPFAAAWFTLSSHGPYTLPDEFKSRYRSPNRTMDQMVEYVDDVLEELFREISTADWYENTLFVITADHSSLRDEQIYNSPNTLYRIPLLLFTPDGSVASGVDSLPASQLDITPTILSHLNYNEPIISLGNDLFDPSAERFAVSYVNDLYQLMEDDYLLQFDTESAKSVGLYNRIDDPMLESNILAQEAEVAQKMERRIKAFLQQYTHRIRENRLSAQTERDSMRVE